MSEKAVQDRYMANWGAGEHISREALKSNAAGLMRRLGPWAPTQSARCLDLACGTGELLYGLERAGNVRLVGVDLRAQALEEGRRLVRAEFVQADVIKYLQEADSGSFDFITAFNLLEHLPQDALPGFLEQLQRVLAPGGSFVAMVPNALSPFGSSTRYWDITHVTAFTPASVVQLAQISGWEPSSVDFRECGPVPYGLKSSVRWAAWQGIRGAIASWFLIENGSTRGHRVFTMDMMFRLIRASR
jgi:SAM-dependent methyltransferase